MAISMLKIRRPLGRLIFNMGIAIPGKTVFLIETAPRIFSYMNSLEVVHAWRASCFENWNRPLKFILKHIETIISQLGYHCVVIFHWYSCQRSSWSQNYPGYLTIAYRRTFFGNFQRKIHKSECSNQVTYISKIGDLYICILMKKIMNFN